MLSIREVYHYFYCLIKLINNMMSSAKNKSSKKKNIESLSYHDTMTPFFREKTTFPKRKHFWKSIFGKKIDKNKSMSWCHTKNMDLLV